MRKGEITEYFDAEEVDYSDFEIGDAWIKKDVLRVETPQRNFKTTKRELIPIPSDDTFIKYLSSEVSESKEIVCLSSYMMQQCELTDALLAAASRGVRVYVLTAGEEELAKADTDMDDIEKMRLEGYRQLLNSLAGKVLIRTAPHFHAKFLLIDPQSEHRRGVMMTCNATLDAMTGKNLEAAITLTKTEISSYFSQFVRAFWQEAKHELLRAGELSGIHQTPKNISFGQVTHPATFANCTSLKECIRQLIDSAEKNIVVTGWSFGANHPILGSLTKALERGVTVKIFARPTFGNTEALVTLATKGANVQGHDRYHAKMIIVDSKKSLLMTSNFTERGLDSGFEIAVELAVDETVNLSTIANNWEQVCEWILYSNLQLKNATHLVRRKAITIKKLVTLEVNEAIVKDLGSRSFDSLDKPLQKPSFESANPNIQSADKIYRRVTYKWRVSPPILPKRASLDKSTNDSFQLYRMPNGECFVTVSRWEDIELARPLAEKWKAKIVIHRNRAVSNTS
jgi:cardiolipin synthase